MSQSLLQELRDKKGMIESDEAQKVGRKKHPEI